MGAATGAPAIEWLRNPAALESLREEWTALETAVEHRTVLSSFDFLFTWYRNYTGEYGGDALIGIAHRDSRLAGVAPLTLRRGSVARIPVTRVDFAPNDSPVGAFLVEDDRSDTITAFVDSLVEREKLDVICLNGFDPGCEHLAAVENAAARHGLAIEVEEQSYAYADVSQGYARYRAGLGGEYRRKVNQKGRRIESAGGRVDGVWLHEGAREAPVLLERLIAVTEASYKLKGQRLADPHRNYLADLIERFGPRGMLSLSLLSIDGQDAACLLGLVERGTFYDINLAYAEPFARYSPGVYLMQKTLEKLASAGVHTVISHGAHEYKRHWATRFIAQKRVYLFPPRLRAIAARFIRFSVAPRLRRFTRAEEEPVSAL